MMVDSRHGFTDLDLQLLEYVSPRVRTGEVKLLVLLTKSDKLNRQESTLALAAAQASLDDLVTDESDIGITLFSSLNRTGLEDVAETVRGWVPAASAVGPEDAPDDEGSEGAEAAEVDPADDEPPPEDAP
jgi:GTP-binding protein